LAQEIDLMPLISVCIAAEPFEDYLPEAVNSLLKQSFADFEVLICCAEGSKSSSFVDAEAKSDSRLRRIDVPLASTRDAQLNCALLSAKGSLIQFLEATDSLQPNCLQAYAQAFALCASVTLVVSAYQLVTSDGSIIESLPGEYPNSVVSGREITKQSLLKKEPALAYLSAACFRKDFALAGLNQKFFLLSHYEFLARIAAQGDCLFLSERHCNVRKFSHQTRSNLIQESLLSLHDYLFLRDTFEQFLKTEKLELGLEDFFSDNWAGKGGIAERQILQELKDRVLLRITSSEAIAAAREIQGWDDDYVLECYVRLAWQLSDSLHWLNHSRTEAIAEARNKAARAHKRGRDEMQQELQSQIERQVAQQQSMQKQIDSLHAELAQLKQDHSTVLKSSSWRLTAPIRKLRAGMLYSRKLSR
jgi:glycosyltransferase involved in cell wall biosynthesis